MGRTVSNLYGNHVDSRWNTLEVISAGIYQIEIVFNAEHLKPMQKYRWCFEQSKALVYTMDLTMELPKALGYKTPRVYLRDYIVYLQGLWVNNKSSVIWTRESAHEYRFDVKNTRPILQLV